MIYAKSTAIVQMNAPSPSLIRAPAIGLVIHTIIIASARIVMATHRNPFLMGAAISSIHGWETVNAAVRVLWHSSADGIAWSAT